MVKRLEFIALAVITIFGIACGGEGASSKQKVAATVPVKVIRAEISTLENQSAYSGTVEPIERVKLSTRMAGWVDKINYAEGDAFDKGDVLVNLRSKDLEAKRATAEAASAEAEVYFNNSERNLQRIEKLFAEKAATQKELDDMSSAFAGARSRKTAAEKMKIEVDEILKYSNIEAPFSGVVARKFLQEGDLANPGQALLEIENSDRVKIVAKVPEGEIQMFAVGQEVSAQIQALKMGTAGAATQGIIDKIVPAADPMSRQFDIHVVLDNPEGKIRSGMFARILVSNFEGGGILVPHAAVFERGQLQGIFVVDEENLAHLRWIRSGDRQNGRLNILSGLNPGELVVVEGAKALLDGQPVEVK